MVTIGAVVAAWGLSALRRSRSLAAVLRQPPLLLAAAGGTVTLAALPVDAAWHARFGRDAVLWSPPHMLAVFGSLALLVGFLGAARPDTSPWILTGLGALLLGSAAVPVLEFETDVPQFSEVAAGIVLYALGGLLLALIIRQVRGPARTQPVLHSARTRGTATHGGGLGHRRAPGRLGR